MSAAALPPVSVELADTIARTAEREARSRATYRSPLRFHCNPRTRDQLVALTEGIIIDSARILTGEARP